MCWLLAVFEDAGLEQTDEYWGGDTDNVVVFMYIISDIDVTSVIAIAMDIWCDRHVGVLSFCIVFTLLCALAIRSCSLATAAALMYDPATIWAHCHCILTLATYSQCCNVGNP